MQSSMSCRTGPCGGGSGSSAAPRRRAQQQAAQAQRRSPAAAPAHQQQQQQQQQQGQQQRRRRVRAAASGGVDLAREKVGVPPPPAESKGLTYKITMVAAGNETRTFDCPDNVYILTAAEEAGLDLPATCRAGICGACVARRASGGIDQSDVADISFTLTDGEVDAGMTLLCMARATSDCTFETQSDWGYSLGIAEWQGATGAFTSKPDPLMGTSWAEGDAPRQ
jgi:ferredoxin